jgi:hypothetical protein
MARGNARQKIARDDADRQRLIDGLEHAVIRYVVNYYDVEPALLAKRHDPHRARAVAAWLCRRHAEATLGELVEWLGLLRADSVANLTRRLPKADLSRFSRSLDVQHGGRGLHVPGGHRRTIWRTFWRDQRCHRCRCRVERRPSHIGAARRWNRHAQSPGHLLPGWHGRDHQHVERDGRSPRRRS